MPCSDNEWLVRSIEWYDGVVLGIVRRQHPPGLFLASLLAWNVERNERAYALVPLAEEEARSLNLAVENVQSANEEDWLKIQIKIERLVRAYSGPVEIGVCRRLGDGFWRSAMFSIGDEGIRDQLVPDVEEVVEAGRLEMWVERIAMTDVTT